MSDFTVISETSDALLRVLWEEIQLDPAVNPLIDNEDRLSLQSPHELKDNDSVRLSVYLYRIVEDPYMKNRPPVQGAGLRQRRAPLTLDLFYLVTPLVGLPKEQQIVLGKVLQVFHDRPLLEGTDVSAAMADAGEELRIVLNPVSLEETTRVWQALEMSYRLSVCYVVRVTMIESTRTRETQPVVARTNRYGEG
jgi:Pvc16 N-terminal domain